MLSAEQTLLNKLNNYMTRVRTSSKKHQWICENWHQIQKSSIPTSIKKTNLKTTQLRLKLSEWYEARHYWNLSWINSVPTTKRGILQTVLSVYDPLWLFRPITLSSKLLVQQLWCKGFEWDQQLTLDDQELWNQISRELQLIENLQIPRFIGMTDATAKYTLVCFIQERICSSSILTCNYRNKLSSQPSLTKGKTCTY